MRYFIKDFVWFVNQSRSYTNQSYLNMLFDGLIKRALWFCKQQRIDRAYIKKNGAVNWYLNTDRTMHFDKKDA